MSAAYEDRALYQGDVWVRIDTLPRIMAEGWRRNLMEGGVVSVVRTPFQWSMGSPVIETLIERVGRTSWTGVARILADGVPCAFARSVQVRVDDQGLPAVIPPGFAERIASVLVRAATL